MKIRHRDSDSGKIQLEMTPMIDIVFQLLVFFIMTFKVVAVEGDFNIKMPRMSAGGAPSDQLIPPLRVRLTTPQDPNAPVCGIYFGQRQLASFEDLRNEVAATVGGGGPNADADEYEVELDCDFDLPYRFVIDAITAVSGYRDPSSGQIVPLVRKIKFAPPRQASGG